MNGLSLLLQMKNFKQTTSPYRNPKFVRAVAYPRFSDGEDQREESITAQMRAIEAYCKERGYHLVAVYPDESKSATTDNRPNFQRMMEDASKDIFDVVIVHKLDRFSRDKFDSVIYKRYLKQLGIKVESVLERLDGSPESIILESLLEGMSEYYSANLAREVRKGLLENALKAMHTGGRPPYGLTVNQETLLYEIDQQRSFPVLFYFEGIDTDKAVQWIADRLNELGYRTQTGKKFTVNSFDGWATNRKYVGDYVYNKQVSKDALGRRNAHRHKPQEEQIIIKDAFPAIVPRDLFDRVQEKVKMRKRKPGMMKAKVTYLLTGKIFCGCPDCLSPYEGDSYMHRSGKRYAYYKCKSKCGNVNLRKEDFEDLVIAKLADAIFSEDAILLIAKRTRELYLREREARKDDSGPIKKEIAELESKIENWLDLVGSGIRSVVEKIKEAELKIELLRVELSKLDAMAAAHDIDEKYIVQFMMEQKKQLFSDSEDDRKALIQEFVEKVVVIPSDGKRKGDSFNILVSVRGFGGTPSGAPLIPLTEIETIYRRGC